MEILNPGGTVVDLNNPDPQDVYTVPTGKVLLPLEALYHSPAPGLVGNGETTHLRLIESDTGTIVVTSTISGGPNTFQIGRAVTPTKIITAGNKLQFKPDVAYGSEQTAVVATFGYLFDVE